MIISEKKQSITSAKELAAVCHKILATEHEIDKSREHFWAIGINTKNVIQYVELVSLGSLSASIVHPRETFRFAVMKGVAALFIAHNHPSGDTKPSQEDILLTRRLTQAGEVLGIKILDHIIVSGADDYGYFSFSETGMIASG